MDDTQRIILAIAARILSYPGETFPEELNEIDSWLKEEAPVGIKEDVKQAVEPLTALSLKGLREVYVSTFDLKEKTGLYLTSQELGDSRKRGPALIKLQKIINEAGYERDDGELADFMPMLFEFLAVAEESRHTRQLFGRLGQASQKVRDQLEEDNRYVPIFNVLKNHVFPSYSEEELEKMERQKEQPDLGQMPYPLMYDDKTGM